MSASTANASRLFPTEHWPWALQLAKETALPCEDGWLVHGRSGGQSPGSTARSDCPRNPQSKRCFLEPLRPAAARQHSALRLPAACQCGWSSSSPASPGNREVSCYLGGELSLRSRCCAHPRSVSHGSGFEPSRSTPP